MVKTRVHDLAAEFGVPAEQLMGMLKDMNIFVRSHLSALENDQVAQIRVRWEREKRKSAEEPPRKGRRKAVKAAEVAPAPVEVKPAKRRRTAADSARREPDRLRCRRDFRRRVDDDEHAGGCYLEAAKRWSKTARGDLRADHDPGRPLVQGHERRLHESR